MRSEPKTIFRALPRSSLRSILCFLVILAAFASPLSGVLADELVVDGVQNCLHWGAHPKIVKFLNLNADETYQICVHDRAYFSSDSSQPMEGVLALARYLADSCYNFSYGFFGCYLADDDPTDNNGYFTVSLEDTVTPDYRQDTVDAVANCLDLRTESVISRASINPGTSYRITLEGQAYYRYGQGLFGGVQLFFREAASSSIQYVFLTKQDTLFFTTTSDSSSSKLYAFLVDIFPSDNTGSFQVIFIHSPPHDPYVTIDGHWDTTLTGPGTLIWSPGSFGCGHHNSDCDVYDWSWDSGNNKTWGTFVDRKWAQFVNPVYGVWDLDTSYSEVAVFSSQDHGPYPQEALEHVIWGCNDFDSLNAESASWVEGDLDRVYVGGWSTAGEPPPPGEACNDDYTAVWRFSDGSSYRYIKLQSIWSAPFNEPKTDAVRGVLGTSVFHQIETLDPDPNPLTSGVMQGGTVHRYYRALDLNDVPRPGVSVGVEFNFQSLSFTSAEYGIVDIPLAGDDLGSPGETTQVAITSLNGVPLDTSEQMTFDVKIERRRFEKSWDVLSKVTCEGGVGVGLGIGPLGIRGAQASVMGEGGMGINLKLLKGEEANDVLVFGRRFEGSIGGKLAVGKLTMVGSEYRIGGEGSAKILVEGRQEFTLDDPYADQDQLMVQSGLLLETLKTANVPFSPGTSIFMNAIIDAILQSSGAQQLIVDATDLSGFMLGIEGQLGVGFETRLINSSLSRYLNFKLLNAEYNFSLMGGIDQFDHSVYYDQYPGREREVFVRTAQSFDVRFLSTEIAYHLSPDFTIDITRLLPNWGVHFGGSNEQRVEFDQNWNLLGGTISLSADDKDFGTVGEQHTFETVIHHYPPEIMQQMIDLELNLIRIAYSPIQALSVDPMSMDNDYSRAVGSALNLVYELQDTELDMEKEEEKIIVYDATVTVPIELEVGVGGFLNVGGGITVTDSRKYLTERTKIVNVGDHIFPLEAYSDDSYVQTDNRDFATIAFNMLSGVVPLVLQAINNMVIAFGEFIDNVGETVVQTGGDIIDGGAQLVVGVGEFATNSIAQIIAFVPQWPTLAENQITGIPYTIQKTQTLRYGKAALPETTTVIVTAVGDAYQVDVFDPDSTVIESYPSPLDFKIVVTDQDLSDAGFAPDDRPSLQIYRWDDDSSRAVALPSGHSGDTVKTQIIAGGQYFAGLTGLPPDTVAPSYNYFTPESGDTTYNPYQPFEIELVDSSEYASGLNPWSVEFLVDGDTVMPELVISDFYHIRISWLPYPDSQWSTGTHAIHLSISDNHNNGLSLNTEFMVCIRGDASGDAVVDIGDVVYLVNYLYRNGDPPIPTEAGDANSDGVVNVGDVVYLVNYLYRNGDPPGCP